MYTFIGHIRFQIFFISVNISVSVIPKGPILAFRNGFAPVKILNVIPKSQIYHGNGNASLMH
jgi:hypothetical protein